MTSKSYIGVGRAPDGQFFWWLTTSSGRRLFNSERFASKRSCELAIAEMKRELRTAPTMDITAHQRPSGRGMRLAA